MQNARRAVREARPVRARQDEERGGGDGEKEKRLLSYHLRLNVEKQASFGGLLKKEVTFPDSGRYEGYRKSKYHVGLAAIQVDLYRPD